MKTKRQPIATLLILSLFLPLPLTEASPLPAVAGPLAPSPAHPLSPTNGTTTRVSVASDGTQGNGTSYWPSIPEAGSL